MNSSITSAVLTTSDGIVSKKLLKGTGGNVTLFAFDSNQSLESHSTPYKALVLALEGEASFQKKNGETILKKGDYLTLEENEEHSLRAITPFKMLLIILKS